MRMAKGKEKMLSMKKISAGAATGLLACGLVGGIAAPSSALSAPNVSSDKMYSSESTDPIGQFKIIGDGLIKSDVSRNVEKTSQGQKITFYLKDNINITLFYDESGNLIIPKNSETINSGITPYVSAGADPWPYIDLDSTEQAAAAAGTAGTLSSMLCEAVTAIPTVGLSTKACLAAGGFAATAVAVATAHGMCPNEQTLRLYVLPLLAGDPNQDGAMCRE